MIQGFTFKQFCEHYNVTGHEKKKLVLFLAALRLQKTLQLQWE